MKSLPSKSERIFDADSTIEQYCETKVLTPLTVQSRERWFRDVAIVVDASPTMAVWGDAVRSFSSWLESYGAFSRVTRFDLIVEKSSVRIRSISGLRHEPGELANRDGRRLILVLSDCVGSFWHGHAIWQVMGRWGDAAPVALLQMLPSRLWSATAMGVADTGVLSGGAGRTNRELRVRPPWWWSEGGAPAIVTPVITLDERRVGAWARMVMGDRTLECLGVVTQPPRATGSRDRDGEASARDRVAAFRATVSREAYRLAVLLSAIEVTLPLAQYVLGSLIEDPDQTYLAEVVASGLLQIRSVDGNLEAADRYEFLPEVREVLQEGLTTADTVMVWRTVAPYLEATTGQEAPFAILLSQDGAAHASTGEGEASDLSRIAAKLIERLGLSQPSSMADLPTSVVSPPPESPLITETPPARRPVIARMRLGPLRSNRGSSNRDDEASPDVGRFSIRPASLVDTDIINALFYEASEWLVRQPHFAS